MICCAVCAMLAACKPKPIELNVENRNQYLNMRMIYDDDSSSIRFGIATCMPVDNFDKKIGRAIAEKNAMENPFHIIENFSGRRNDYADEAMGICLAKEQELLMRDYPWIFNEENFID